MAYSGTLAICLTRFNSQQLKVLINMYRSRGNYCIYKTLKCVIKGCCCCCCCVKINDLFYWSVNGTDITILYHTIPYHTIPYHTIPYHTIPYHTIPYHTIPYHTIPYHTIPYHTIPYHTIPYHTIPYHTIPYYTDTILILYYTDTILSLSKRLSRASICIYRSRDIIMHQDA